LTPAERNCAHALVCFLASILYQVLRMRLRASQREESPATLLAQWRRIHHQSAQTPEGHVLRGLTELGCPANAGRQRTHFGP
jgi:hypothetical protein